MKPDALARGYLTPGRELRGRWSQCVRRSIGRPGCEVFDMRALPLDFNGFDEDRGGQVRDRRRVGGATLLEVSVVVAAVATLAAFAVPRFDAAREAARSSAAHQALLASLMAAPTHAASTGAEVVVCPGTPTGCAGTHDWSGGWIVFADLDGDRIRDSASETLVHRAGPM
jgi:type IV fimbrial biogenesis protein FimT